MLLLLLLLLVVARSGAQEYALMPVAHCIGGNTAALTSRTECEAAAAALQLNLPTTATPRSESTEPAACWVMPGYSGGEAGLFWNHVGIPSSDATYEFAVCRVTAGAGGLPASRHERRR